MNSAAAITLKSETAPSLSLPEFTGLGKAAGSVALFFLSALAGFLCAQMAGFEFAVSLPLTATAQVAGGAVALLSGLIVRAGAKGSLKNVLVLGNCAALIVGFALYVVMV